LLLQFVDRPLGQIEQNRKIGAEPGTIQLLGGDKEEGSLRWLSVKLMHRSACLSGNSRPFLAFGDNIPVGTIFPKTDLIG